MTKFEFIEQYSLQINTLHKEYEQLKRNFTEDLNGFFAENPNDGLTFDLGQVYAHVKDTEENLYRIRNLMAIMYGMTAPLPEPSTKA